MRRGNLFRVFAAVAAVAAPVAAAVPATAATSLEVGEAVSRTCAADVLGPGAPGAERRSWTAPAAGLAELSLTGPRGSDWDLAIFERGRNPAMAASTASGASERAGVWVEPGERLVAQGCRLSGSARSVRLSIDLFPGNPAPGDPGRPRLVSVSLSGAGALNRLERRGFDVTHDVSADAASVVVYSRSERRELEKAGFEPRTEVGDLTALDAADRRAEERAAAVAGASMLPSGRETYRVYEDYTTELRDLAEENPAIAREVVLGTSFEGRPIQGIEIATGVNRTDDGRPVYLNMGVHHAREWPSGELAMEFARDLVANADDARVGALLDGVRTVIIPVVNPDGFIASRSYGTSPLDDNEFATLPLALNDQAAYKRKNCRPTVPGTEALPCALRSNSGVDLNRNYGAYWGGPGSSSDPTSQGYRGTGPFSEPESEAVHSYSSGIHPTVFITNHTYTADGKWLRQPGFDAAFLPSDSIGALTPDEDAMKDLGDDMAAATGWTSERGYETLGDITGATEDWNYFAQGTYGYTPEARGPNFHANYADAVVEEYVGDAQHPGEGVREAFLVAGERAADPAEHSVISGTAPPGATLTLSKQFETPTSQPGLDVDDQLDTEMTVPASGNYEWHVNPSSRPLVPGEVWTMTCTRPSQSTFTRTVAVGRAAAATENWAGACGADPPVNQAPVPAFEYLPAAPVTAEDVNFTSTSTDPDGAIATTEWDLDDDGEFDDATGLNASRSFPAAGDYDVSVKVTDDDGAASTLTRTITVSASPPVNAPPTAGFDYSPAAPVPQEPVNFNSTSADTDGSIAKLEWDLDDDGEFDDAQGGQVTRSFPAPGSYEVSLRATDDDDAQASTSRTVVIGAPVRCKGTAATMVGTDADDALTGTSGRDVIVGRGGADTLTGLGGRDLLCGNRGADLVRGGPGNDFLRGGQGRDLLRGGAGRDRCRGGRPLAC